MSPRLRAMAANLALAVFSIALVLGTAEVVLRVLARQTRGGKEQRERNRYTEYDPVLGWRKTPGAAVVYDRREYHVEFRVNGQGLRGPDRPYTKPPGVARVLALGDSFVEAFMVEDAQTVTARLEADLAARGCRVEVINGGTVGYSTDQEYLFYRDEGRKYAPDVVVVFVYQNDIPYLAIGEYLGYPKPQLDFSTDPPTVANEPVPRYEAPALAEGAAPEPVPSFVLEFVKNALERTSARTYNRLARAGLWEPLRQLPINDEIQLFHVPELGHLRPAWSAFTWTLETLNEAVAAAGGRLMVAYVPGRMEVNPRTWELTEARYGLDPSAYDA
ncbi:MAG TPA: SGNH/GDSL hydrolase family protein, partial [Vicinamibacteria bacterium]|nr:SGNH/GDSL hydrolase family protein [Vicinamibacteria bacterium]